MELEWLSSLNNEQRKIVTHPDGHMLVLAGAGSGKTRILVHRIAWLLEQGCTVREVMAVTFTNKAASEMKRRLEGMLGCSVSRMWIGTFHGLAHRMLRQHHDLAGLTVDFQIIDSDDQQRIVRDIQREMNLDKEVWPVKDAVSFINRHKEQGIRAQQVTEGDKWGRTQLEIYRQYEQICQQSSLVDFTELLLRSYELLQHNEELRQYYQQQFRHVLVDEFQDTNVMQYQWVKLLSDNGYLLAVGDDDQSIYSWRGAEVANMRRLQQDYRDLELIRLEQNYRSTAKILTAANAVIANNHNRFGKQLWTQDRGGEPIVVYHAKDDRDEARFISQQITTWISAGGQYQDVVVLYRSNNQSRTVEEQLTRAGIRYRVYGGLRFYDRAEVKDLLAYLRLVSNEHDNVALARVINLPNRGVGDATVQRLNDLAGERHVPLMTAVKQALQDKTLRGNIAQSLQELVALLDRWRTLVDQLKLYELASCIKDDLRLIEHYQKARDYTVSRKENLEELINGMRDFVPDNPDMEPNNWGVMREYLASVTLDADQSEERDNELTRAEYVSLMSMHAAKGLEFPVVFMVGMEEGLFPNARSLKESEDNLEEERRLCYVGMTRAQRKLYLSWCSYRNRWGNGVENSVRSRFLDELPGEVLQELESNYLKFTSVYHGNNGSGFDNFVRYRKGVNYCRNSYGFDRDEEDGNAYRGNGADELGNASRRSRLLSHEYAGDSSYTTPRKAMCGISSSLGQGLKVEQQGDFKLQQRVFHEVYGFGTIVGFDGSGLVKVLFEKLNGSGKIKTISPDYLKQEA